MLITNKITKDGFKLGAEHYGRHEMEYFADGWMWREDPRYGRSLMWGVEYTFRLFGVKAVLIIDSAGLALRVLRDKRSQGS